MATNLTRARPTMTSADLNRSPTGYRLDQRPTLTSAPIQGAAMSVTRTPPRPAATPRTVVARAPQPNVAGMTGFQRENTLANAGVYDPGTVGASNAVANGTGRVYQPPQQTERANPLTGDNNIPPEGATTGLARVPFVQRGAALPQGQDALPAAVRATETMDDTIAGSMQGTQDRLRGGTGVFSRRFASPQKADAYAGYLRRVQGN